jgi:hypothetical protein
MTGTTDQLRKEWRWHADGGVTVAVEEVATCRTPAVSQDGFGGLPIVVVGIIGRFIRQVSRVANEGRPT